MKIFLDANILVSVINKEYPLFTYTSRIVSLADHKKFTLFTSPVCLAIAFYFAEKKYKSISAKKRIQILCEHIHIAPVNKSPVLQCLQNPAINDFEDGLEYYAAVESKCDCFITEDIEDFYFSKIEVLRSEDFFQKHLFSS
ncbi:PIN domain-containing protein [Ginsengibacter hankyongi]|uniref:PIN domain-containing protein n=1 Tax=Ginsengibacter hankyongi TaxID=2607284 RepID=A0A5J5IBT5_9BACT|nr:PIN domain-containing protein [Ginsengibacter hankyongi]KAA9034345.1 PIN domain-containing protein [Ginsengibacter hankyongi]